MSTLFSKHQINSVLGLRGPVAAFKAPLMLEGGSRSHSPEAKQLVPFQEQSISSAQQSVPLPFFGGTQLIALRWDSPALDQINHEVPASGKKS